MDWEDFERAADLVVADQRRDAPGFTLSATIPVNDSADASCLAADAAPAILAW